MTTTLIGIDIGTSSSKAVLTDSSGKILARATRPHPTSLPRPGWAEHASDLWWSDVLALVAELLRDGARPAAVAVSGIGPCLLPADREGRPLRPAILYGIDTRAHLEIEEITASLGVERILERGGSALTSQAVGPKLLWLRRNEPDVWAATERFFMASSYVVHRLTGEYILDHHSASQCDPMYDLAAEAWATDWIRDIAPPGLELPRLAWSSDVVGHVTPDAARVTGLVAGTPVAAGTIDAWSEALSVGVRDPGDTMLMYGTTMFVIRVVDQPVADPTLWLTTGVVPGSRTSAAGMATSGALTAWFRELVGSATFEGLEAEAAVVPAGADGLVALPYFAGERSPIYDPHARGVLLGLTLRHGRGHVYRALLEATAFAVRHMLDAMEATGDRLTRLVAVGGGSQGALWPRIVSDVTGHRQELPRERIGAAFGDALLAGLASGVVPMGTTWAVPERHVAPDPAARAGYDELYGVYRDAYPATSGLAHRLARIQERPEPKGDSPLALDQAEWA